MSDASSVAAIPPRGFANCGR